MDYRLRVIGNNIRKIREKNNYTIEYVAELAAISPTHLQRIETYKKGVSISCLYRIADSLDVPIAFILKDDTCYSREEAQTFSNRKEENFIDELMQCIQDLKEKYQI